MKIWNGYGSEHSSNLVMIGTFKTIRDADEAKAFIDRLTEQVAEDQPEYHFDLPAEDDRYSQKMKELLRSSSLSQIGPAELEQLIYDVQIEVKGKRVMMTTDESEISAFLKVFIERGARVEVYSAHDYPDDSSAQAES